MSSHDLHWIANYIWGIADDVLRDLYVRGKYRDVILPMTVLRRLDAVLEDSKHAVRWLEDRSLACVKVSHSAKREVETIREFSGRLIADVVTGKLDVREASARLPDVNALAGDDSPPDGNWADDMLES